MSTSVSVIIVTRDRVSVIPACLDSIATQEPRPDQIIIVAGNDESFPSELRGHYAHLPLTFCACESPNISQARNIGLDNATGELVLFLDDDASAHTGWISQYIDAFEHFPDAWVAGGEVMDARCDPSTPEFAFGLIHPSGRQVEVHDVDRDPMPRGYLTSVKGCNFGLRRDRIPADIRFDPFFAFAFDESDLVMQVHSAGGSVLGIRGAVVDHLHAPGAYRSDGPMDREWRREFASHTRFMRKHSSGLGLLYGWFVITRRLLAHSARALIAAFNGQISIGRAVCCVLDAIKGIMRGRSSRDSV